MRVVASGLVLVGFALACGGTAPTAPAPVATVVLSEEDCRTEGLGATVVGRLEVDLINRTADPARFDLIRLNDGHSYDELVAVVAEDNRRVKQGENTVGPWAFATLLQISLIDAGTYKRLEAQLIPGRYTVVCIRATATPRSVRIATGPFRIH